MPLLAMLRQPRIHQHYIQNKTNDSSKSERGCRCEDRPAQHPPPADPRLAFLSPSLLSASVRHTRSFGKPNDTTITVRTRSRCSRSGLPTTWAPETPRLSLKGLPPLQRRGHPVKRTHVRHLFAGIMTPQGPTLFADHRHLFNPRNPHGRAAAQLVSAHHRVRTLDVAGEPRAPRPVVTVGRERLLVRRGQPRRSPLFDLVERWRRSRPRGAPPRPCSWT